MSTTTTTTSSEPPAKRQKAAAEEEESPPYELLYHAGIPGRGEFVRLAFEATRTPYTDVCNTQKNGVSQLYPLLARSPTAPTTEQLCGPQNIPPFAPPLLRHGSVLLSQTPAILLYLGPKLGLAPEGGDGVGAFHVHALALTALDAFSNEPHDVHHPVATGLTYEEQKPEAARAAQAYLTQRLPRWLAYFERVLDSAASAGGEWLYAGKMSYADLVLWQGLDGTCFAFPNATRKLRAGGDYEKVWALYERVKGLDAIREYLASRRRRAYGNGIWRHYPELDLDADE